MIIPPRSFDDVLSGGYKVITYKDSSNLQFLMLSPLGSAKRTYYEEKMRGDSSALYSSEQEMIKVVLREPKTLMWQPSMVAAGDKRLRALPILDYIDERGAFGYPKRSEFRHMFDYHLLKMKEYGIRERLSTNYEPESPLQIGIDDAEQLGYDALLFPMILLLAGGCGALLIMLLECFAKKCNALWYKETIKDGTLTDYNEVYNVEVEK